MRCVYWLRKPQPYIGLASRSRRLCERDCQSRRRSCQKRRWIYNGASISTLPTQPRILDNVLSLNCTSEHAISDAEQARANSLKHRKSVIMCGDLHGVNSTEN